MVNKQYTIKNHHSVESGKRYSPPPVRNLSIISDAPNPGNLHSFLIKDKCCRNENECEDSSCDEPCEGMSTSNREEQHSSTSTYGRNVSLYNRSKINDRSTKDYGPDDSDQRFFDKGLSINDIGRFQYILQMDREMGTHPETLYRIPARGQKSSSNSSVNSSHQINFWKAGSETPMTTSTTDSSRRRQDIYRHLKDFWKYAKWPLVLIVCCVILGCVVAYIVTDQKKSSDGQMIKANVTSLQPPDGLIGNPNHMDHNHLKDEAEVLTIYMRNPKITTTDIPKASEPVLITTIREEKEEEEKATEETIIALTEIPHSSQATTTTSSFRNTQILKITNQDGLKVEHGFEDPTIEFEETDKIAPPPTKETLEIIGFTSGHQNNFGVPIEEDERILKILNKELLSLDQNETIHAPTTDSSVNKARVSPTLPVIFHRVSTTEGSAELFNTTDVGNCESTSMAICRGILHYDLTTTRSKHKLSTTEIEHFKYLFDSKCSTRASEFVCSALEPECRPTQMGILQPCKRICKSILEPCASIIASSEILTMTFDCDRYPDSSDRNVCEDPTRRGKCTEIEFKCLDSSCIPQQWKCDNIKDCSLGEDEDNCLFCEHEEFRCQTNDKCIPDKWRCDQYDDCSDGSDEMDCYDYEEDQVGGGEDFGNPRIYSFASIQSPDNPNNQPYHTISEEEPLTSEEKKAEVESDRDHFLSSAAEHVESLNDKQFNEATRDDNDEIQTGEASGRLITGLPKNIANFQDSKEIMMTSDSETDFKYSEINRTKSTSTTDRTYDEITFKNPHCPENQLRCVTGECITVSQICDRTVDCPDGADEAMCVYKDQ